MGSINVTVTGFQGRENGIISSLPGGDGIDAQPELRDDDAVVKGKGSLVMGYSVLVVSCSCVWPAQLTLSASAAIVRRCFIIIRWF